MLLNTTFGKSLENEVKGQVTSKEQYCLPLSLYFLMVFAMLFPCFEVILICDIIAIFFLQMYARVIMF